MVEFRPMKIYFRPTECPRCHSTYDPIENRCPSCGQVDPSRRDFHAFEHQVRDSWPRQILYFVLGWLGFQVLGAIVGLLVQLGFVAANPGATGTEIQEYASSVNGNTLIISITYAALIGVFALILGLTKRFPRFAESFKDYRNYLWGLAGFAAVFAFQLLYGTTTSYVLKVMGYVGETVNANESTLRAMCRAFPAVCIIVFGLLGPMVEEIGYRVGLFGLAGRFGKVWGYILSSLVFGAIHFNWGALWTPELQATLPVELLNLPGYIISGALLAFFYDRFGLAASYTAHALNNLVAILINTFGGTNQ